MGPVQELVPVRQTRVRVEVLHDEGVLLVDILEGFETREGRGEPARGRVRTGAGERGRGEGRGRGRSLVRRVESRWRGDAGVGAVGKNRSCVVPRTTRGRFPNPGAKWEKWEGTNGPPGTERARVWGGGGSGGEGDAPSKTSCRSKRRGYSRDGWSGAVVSWTSPVRRPRVGPGEESVCVESVGRTPTELTVDGPLEAVFSQGGRPSRGARTAPAAPCAWLSSSWRALQRSPPRARRVRSFSR